MYSKRNHIIILSGLFLVTVGLGITLPILPYYIQNVLNDGLSKEKLWLHVGLITSAYPLTQFLFLPYLGSLSDRIGRRPLILTGLAGYAVSTFIFSVSDSLIMLYFSRLLSGFFTAAFLTASTAYIADITSAKERGSGMSSLLSVTSLGIVAGPLIGNLFSKTTFTFGAFALSSFSLAFMLSAALVLVTFALLFFMLPETKLHAVRHSGEKGTDQKPSVLQFLKTIKRSFILLLFISFMGQFSLAMFEGTFALHAQRLFSFGPRQMSIVFMVCGSLMGILELGPVAWLINKKGEKKLLPYALFIVGVGMALLMIPKEIGWIVLFVAVISVGLSILSPAMSSLVTKHSGKNYGISLGVFSSANSLAQVLGVLIGSVLMIWFTHLPYFLIAALLFITAYVSFSAFHKKTAE